MFCRVLRSYGNVIILYADECYAIKAEVNYLMSKVECQVPLHTFSIPPSLFLTKNIVNVFLTIKLKLFQLICKNVVITFVLCIVGIISILFIVRFWGSSFDILKHLRRLVIEKDVTKQRCYFCKLQETRTRDILNRHLRRIYH